MSQHSQVWLSQGAEVLARRIGENANGCIDCDVLVVGSGYGGSVAAARLAGWTIDDPTDPKGRRPLRVWVLERGSEHVPGSFPSRLGDLPGEVRFSRQDGMPPRGRPDGLFDLRLGPQVNVVLGNGLGGGSLINAGVMVRPDAKVFEKGWPGAITLAELAPYYAKASGMLAPESLAPGVTLPKLQALQALAQKAGKTMERAPIAVHFGAESMNAQGVTMQPCQFAGDCVTGCNQGAKKTLDTNYLALAWRRGAEIFCGGWVEAVARDPSGSHWIVDWHFTRTEPRPPGDRPWRLRAAHVVLAAGSLGSTEILLRSRERGLRVSPALGTRFSTNGDMIAAVFRQKDAVHASADEDTPVGAHGVGPTITGMARLGDEGAILIEEFAVPAPMRRLMGEVTTTLGVLHRLFTSAADEEHAADAEQDVLAVTTASLEHTAIYGMMGDDGAAGTVTLARPASSPLRATDATTRLGWSDESEGSQLWRLFENQIQSLKLASGDTGGTVLPNPLYRVLPFDIPGAPSTKAALTVHPLGGCPMGNDGTGGVVDAEGRVFDGGDASVHPGLVVLDGAIVPRALGTNPALTIAALAERAAEKLRTAWWPTAREEVNASRDIPARPRLARPTVRPAATAIRLRERLVGEVLVDGKPYRASLELETETADDLAALLRGGKRRLQIQAATLKLRADDAAATGFELKLKGQIELLDPVPEVGDEAKTRRQDLLDARIAHLGPRLFAGLPDVAAQLLAKTLFGKLRQRGWMERRIVYRFTVVEAGAAPLPKGFEWTATKTIAFDDAMLDGAEGNPWRQLSEVRVEATESASHRLSGRLALDLGDLASRREMLLRVMEQRDQPTAIADLLGLALFIGRIVLATHLLHFLPPDDGPDHSNERLPGRLAGLTLCREPLANADGAMLTRYRSATARDGLAPVMLIHGLSAAGSTFAHPSIPHNLVSYLALEKGRDVWVLELRSSAALEPRRGPFRFEEVALGDIPVAVQRIVELTAAAKVDVVAHCIGSAMFCMAVLQDDHLHEKIGRVVLSQVGPLLRLSPFNRLRGFLASFLQQFLGVDSFDVRPPRGAMTTMLDMLLASWPYPREDQEAARAEQLVGQGRGDFRLVRHRADAIVGQTFELENVGDDSLLALDAIYGWVKLRTLAQVIHLARQDAITDASGDNTLVSPARLQERFAFPVLLLHGRRNRVFDWQGGLEAWRRLVRVFGDEEAASVRDIGCDIWGKGQQRQLRVFDGYGHQDLLIGKNAHEDVFVPIDEFLSAPPESARPQVAPAPRFTCEEPWMGPVLGWLRALPGDPAAVELSVLVRPGGRHATTRCVVLVPAQQDPKTGDWGPGDIGQAMGFHLRPDAADQQEALRQGALTLHLPLPRAPSIAVAFVVLTLHADQTVVDADAHMARPSDRMAAGGASCGFALSAPARKAVREFLERYGSERPRATRFDQIIMRLDPAALAARDHMPLATPGPGIALQEEMSFVLASCQYPPSLFDKWVAGATMARLNKQLREAQPTATPGFMLLVGDQVYVDAVPSVVAGDAGNPHDVVRQAYELNWRLTPFRRVAARLPVYTMLDDHEVVDNWQPARPGERVAEIDRAGLEGFETHQAVLHPRRPGPTASYVFAPGAWPFFVIDTRCWRQRRGIDSADGMTPLERARIVSDADMARLKSWLQDHRDAPAKFIVSPSVVLPLESAYAGRPSIERLRSDSWSGHPASWLELMGFIRDECIRGVVFLSGDAHLSMACRFEFEGSVEGSGPTVHAVVSSGLYSPWPFANDRESDYLLDGAVDVPACAGLAAVRGTMSQKLATPHNSLALISLKADGSGARLDVRFEDGSASPPLQSFEL